MQACQIPQTQGGGRQAHGKRAEFAGRFRTLLHQIPGRKEMMKPAHSDPSLESHSSALLSSLQTFESRLSYARFGPASLLSCRGWPGRSCCYWRLLSQRRTTARCRSTQRSACPATRIASAMPSSARPPPWPAATRQRRSGRAPSWPAASASSART